MLRARRWLALGPLIAVAVGAFACNGGDGGPKEFEEIARKLSDATFTASYKLDANGENPLEGTLIWYKDGRERLRFDLETTQAGENITFTLISSPSQTAFCLDKAGELSDLLGIAADQGVCFGSTPDDDTNPVGDITDFFEEFERADIEIVETSSREVAGRTATCYKVRAKDSDTNSTGCFDDDGVLLSVESEEDEFSLEATEIKDSVSDDDFEPPYEVRDFAGLGGE